MMNNHSSDFHPQVGGVWIYWLVCTKLFIPYCSKIYNLWRRLFIKIHDYLCQISRKTFRVVKITLGKNRLTRYWSNKSWVPNIRLWKTNELVLFVCITIHQYSRLLILRVTEFSYWRPHCARPLHKCISKG